MNVYRDICCKEEVPDGELKKPKKQTEKKTLGVGGESLSLASNSKTLIPFCR